MDSTLCGEVAVGATTAEEAGVAEEEEEAAVEEDEVVGEAGVGEVVAVVVLNECATLPQDKQILVGMTQGLNLDLLLPAGPCSPRSSLIARQ